MYQRYAIHEMRSTTTYPIALSIRQVNCPERSPYYYWYATAYTNTRLVHGVETLLNSLNKIALCS